MGEADRRKRLDDAIASARAMWGHAALLKGNDRELMIRVGTRYALKAVREGKAVAALGGADDHRHPARCGQT